MVLYRASPTSPQSRPSLYTTLCSLPMYTGPSDEVGPSLRWYCTERATSSFCSPSAAHACTHVNTRVLTHTLMRSTHFCTRFDSCCVQLQLKLHMSPIDHKSTRTFLMAFPHVHTYHHTLRPPWLIGPTLHALWPLRSTHACLNMTALGLWSHARAY